VSGEEIDYTDIDRALDMARNGVDLPNREVLKVIPDTFTVDVEEGIKSPI
jgi:cell division ATPase FtsA